MLGWKGSVLGGLDLEQRKGVSTPLAPFSYLPAAASAMGPRQMKDQVGARLGHIQEEVLPHDSSSQILAGRAYSVGAQEGLLE